MEGGRDKKTRKKTRRVKEKQTTMKRVLILFQKHWHILPHFHGDNLQQAFLCHDQHQAYAQQYPWVERRRKEKTKHGRRRGRIMNPSEEAEHSKEAREEQNKGKQSQWGSGASTASCLSAPFPTGGLVELQGRHARDGRHVHLVHISHVNR